jgi:hypothetical protein
MTVAIDGGFGRATHKEAFFEVIGITSHLGGTRLMPVGTGCIANEVFKLPGIISRLVKGRRGSRVMRWTFPS